MENTLTKAMFFTHCFRFISYLHKQPSPPLQRDGKAMLSRSFKDRPKRRNISLSRCEIQMTVFNFYDSANRTNMQLHSQIDTIVNVQSTGTLVLPGSGSGPGCRGAAKSLTKLSPPKRILDVPSFSVISPLSEWGRGGPAPVVPIKHRPTGAES